MEFIIPLLCVLAAVLVVWVAARVLGRRSRAGLAQAFGAPGADGKPVQANPGITRELAVQASARLTPEQHRAVYSMIARQQPLGAIKEFRAATGCSLKEAALSAAALAQFPQPTPEPRWMSEAAAPGSAPDAVQPSASDAPSSSVPDAATPAVDSTPGAASGTGATVDPSASDAPAAPADPVEALLFADPPASWPTEPSAEESIREAAAPVEPVRAQPSTPRVYRYRAIIARGDEIREIVSTRLNSEIVEQVKTLARAGDRDGAAALLRANSDAGADEAAGFVALIGPED
ncbi:hypothetical protein [Arthrobacter sp. 35W]|uniref:hypothetical protein n=1 Tax=Arthrobacter sp. 35W TaxID=1132441 RepID=UPI0004167614|nr:hypothetical protein [Arthrobacter sp. 35W]